MVKMVVECDMYSHIFWILSQKLERISFDTKYLYPFKLSENVKVFFYKNERVIYSFKFKSPMFLIWKPPNHIDYFIPCNTIATLFP